MQKMNADDLAVIRRFQSGDRTAYDDLVRRYIRRAYRFAFRLTRNREEAADVVSVSLLRVLKALDGFKGDSSFATWLFRIETNCYLDMKKRIATRAIPKLEDVSTIGDLQSDAVYIDSSDGPMEESEKSERLTILHNAIARLPENQRIVLYMYHGESMSYEEIAESLDLPIGTVKSRLNRARISLRSHLRPHFRIFEESLILTSLTS
jgi:RNA polymerase sigma-70 factor (ECF subfamily)